MMAPTQLLHAVAAAALLLALPAALGQLDCSRLPGCAACEQVTLPAPAGRALLWHGGFGGPGGLRGPPGGMGGLPPNATDLPPGFNLSAWDAAGPRFDADGDDGGANGTDARFFGGWREGREHGDANGTGGGFFGGSIEGFKRMNISWPAGVAPKFNASRLALPKLDLPRLSNASGALRADASRLGAAAAAAGLKPANLSAALRLDIAKAGAAAAAGLKAANMSAPHLSAPHLNVSKLESVAAAGLKAANLSQFAPKLNLTAAAVGAGAAAGEARGFAARVVGAMRAAAGRRLAQRGAMDAPLSGAMEGGWEMGALPFPFNASDAGRPPRPSFFGKGSSAAPRPFFGAPAANRTVLKCTACTAPAYQMAASGDRCECAPGYGIPRPTAPVVPAAGAAPPAPPACERCPAGQVSGPDAPAPAAPAASPAPGNGVRSGGPHGGPRGHGYPCVACPSGTAANAEQTKCL